ncbi:hypothetical protein GJW-30_1_01963 [Variibacter gotjawalensis]|uniref:Uncharacterized protein n=1 Tax=Variibacter gotjawalensis TaxID=1333996 RepID=A0A0S3PU00_9BRAD|nr:hypothetical protein [Variibacter gotjawalensis]NIK49749.1 hypothetical protein [Variibacter gotjawalensis]RZS45757.1 hypothetical protein EV661_4081 [Variibacter gotjawalensis]BAT59430.1 hypothetical protein GJW-30_1_01963 [Variibacter gotjawalensis]
MAPPQNGDYRKETIEEYLAEATRCERLAERAQETDRQDWLDLAQRWRTLAKLIETA